MVILLFTMSMSWLTLFSLREHYYDPLKVLKISCMARTEHTLWSSGPRRIVVYIRALLQYDTLGNGLNRHLADCKADELHSCSA